MKLVIPKIDSFLKFGMFLMILKVSLNTSSVFYYNETIDTILSYGALIFLFAVIIIQNYSAKQFVLYLLISVISIYSVIVTGNSGFLITIVTCLAIRNSKFYDIIKFIFN